MPGSPPISVTAPGTTPPPRMRSNSSRPVLRRSIADRAISVIGLLVFAGLTAYDTQRLKNDYIQHAQYGDEEWLAKSAIMGALSLYINFINMFMFLLQFLGQRE